MKKAMGWLWVMLACWGLGFAENFDIFDYSIPSGWTKKAQPGGVILSQQSGSSFTSIVLYASVPAGSDLEQNFRGEWKRLITDGLGLNDEPNTEVGPPNGDYQNMAGGIAASQDGVSYVVLLSTFSGNGRAASILYLTSDEKMLDAFDRFNSSLKLGKPSAVQAPKPPSNPPVNTANTRTIATPTTNFDNGWVSTIQNGFVRVAKGENLVLLHYPQPLPEGMWVTGNEEERVNYYWNLLVSPRYKVDELKVFKNGICYFCLYFGEGTATEIATGSRKHVALFIYFESSQGYAVQAISPSFEAFQKDFPNIEALGKMSGYNKFAVKLPDLVGTWDESSSSALNYYNTNTGAYAGMNAVSRFNEFTFNKDGTYSSKHSGASGFVGSQNFYQQEYKGKVTLTDWRITLTNRFDGKTEAYDAYFQMTAAGPVLHLIRVGSSGMTYDLGKKK